VAATGISFADLVERKRTFEVKFAHGVTLEVSYRPDRLTPAHLKRINEALGADDELSFARLAAEILTEWELTGPFAEGTEQEVKAGEPVPITEEHLSHIPGPYLNHIWRSIAEDANPDPKARNRSRGRS
jgi:hypothetical protein